MASKKNSAPAIYKVVMIGESDIGKSSLFIRFRDGKYVETINSTIGLDHTSREVTFKKDESGTEQGRAQIQLWDTAGLERAGRMTNSYYLNSRAVMLMYDVTESATLSHLLTWYEDANLYCQDGQDDSRVKFFLVGNKIDCSSSEIEVKTGTAVNLAKRLNIPEEQVFRISVKTGKGLDKLLNDVARILSETMKPVVPVAVVFDPEDPGRNLCQC